MTRKTVQIALRKGKKRKNQENSNKNKPESKITTNTLQEGGY